MHVEFRLYLYFSTTKYNVKIKGGITLKRFSKFLTVLLVVSMILPGIAQAAPVLTAETSAVQRLAGKGREETAVAASEMAYKDGAGNVVLVGYNGEVDALTGTLLANAKKAPLLITNQASLTETTKKEIARLKAKNVYILGGEKVVSKEVEIELKALKYNVKRIEGADREKTAIAVAKEVGGTINHVFLAKGYDIYADALSVGPVSAIKNMPVFLTNTNSMTPATIQAMKDLGVKEVTIVGGEKTVTKKVEDQLKGIKINRISGDDREKTALAVADKFFPSTETSILASGYTFADALVGGYIGAKMNAPILLTNTNLISAETEEFIADNSLKIYVLGGEKVVSDKVLKKIEAAVKAEKASDITVNETIKLNRNYNSVKVTANNIVVDLGGKTVKELTVSANDTTIKNGTVIKLNIEKTVVNVILEDIVDTEDSEHTFAGGGAKSIVLKGNTNLRGLVEVTSTTPIQIRAEGLNAGQGVTGTLIINTGAPVTIGVPVNEVEVQKENTSIKINAEVKKVNALAKTEITMGKDVKAPILEKAKDVEASAKDNNGKVEDFVVNDKLKPTEPVKPVEPTPGGGGVVKVSAISVDTEELTLIAGGATGKITATVLPADATNKAVTWISDNTDVAIVDTDGVVTPIGPGTATITVTTVDGGFAATCEVKVNAQGLAKATAGIFDIGKLDPHWGNVSVDLTLDEGKTYAEVESMKIEIFNDNTPLATNTLQLEKLSNKDVSTLTSPFHVGRTTENSTYAWVRGVYPIAGALPTENEIPNKVVATYVIGGTTYVSETEISLILPNSVVNISGESNKYYTEIQAAIDAATAGDEIIVGDGDYKEDLTINKAITLKSLNGRESTEIAGTITITANDVTVEGFTVTAQGHYAVPVIHMIDIDNVNILNNTVVADDTAYGAIGTSSAPAKITGKISGNTVTGMIMVGTDGAVEVSNNNVTLTTASTEGICFYPVGPTAVITVTENTVGAVTEGNVQIKVNERPASVNEKQPQ